MNLKFPCPSPGNDIGILEASDRDEEGTLNSRIKYRIVEQSPQIPSGNIFRIETDTGKLQLFTPELNRRAASKYYVKVEVADPGQYITCKIIFPQQIISEEDWYTGCTNCDEFLMCKTNLCKASLFLIFL